METFHKFLPEFCVSPTIHVSWLVAEIGENRPLRSCRKNRLVLPTKKDTRPGHFLAPISPTLSLSRPKFRERCRPLTCACVEYRRLDVVVESCETSVEYRDSTPTLRVSGISVELGRFIPAATVSGISWENGGLDSV